VASRSDRLALVLAGSRRGVEADGDGLAGGGLGGEAEAEQNAEQGRAQRESEVHEISSCGAALLAACAS